MNTHLNFCRGLSTVRLLVIVLAVSPASAQDSFPHIFPEQRGLQIRSPESLPRYDVYSESFSSQAPETVLNQTRNRIHGKKGPQVEPRRLTLDDAIQIALKNSKVVRVLGGVTASSSGRTIYDTAITNTTIDVNQAPFDPNFFFNNAFTKNESPTAVIASAPLGTSTITGITNNGYNMSVGLTKSSVYGTTGSMTMNTIKSMFGPGTFPLDPSVSSNLDINLTQPLLRGADPLANMSPIIIARINTERSFFQYKNSVQNLVRGVIEAYWNLVFARVDVRVRKQQVVFGEFGLRRTEARFKRQLDNGATLAQSQVADYGFRAALITAQANLLQREAALRNLLGLKPEDGTEIVPVSELKNEEIPRSWQELLVLSETNRPDIIELKLVIEADEQALLQSRNQALPSMDAVAQYRWNGLAGEMPNLTNTSSRIGQFTDWTLGVNFSVPLGLRSTRAGVRQQRLIVARDKANLQQGLHAVVHELATNIRTRDQNLRLYQIFKESRTSARFNLDRQTKDWEQGRSIYLNVLQAIRDWGNAISSEASTLTQYNINLAELERITGTILETHGVRFVEERFGAVGPMGSWAEPLFYPNAIPPTENAPRYPNLEFNSEQQFNLNEIEIEFGNPSQRRSPDRPMPPSPNGFDNNGGNPPSIQLRPLPPNGQ